MLPNGLQNVIGMSLILGVASYIVGLAPLSVSLSRKQLGMLSNLGTGLLVGTALGVILPEGVEQLVTDADWKLTSSSFTIGIPILSGFSLMFLLEEYATSHGQPKARPSAPQPGVTFDVDLEELGQELGHLPNPENPPSQDAETSVTRRAYPLSFGLIVHALVDGYALGVSASSAHSPNLSFIVFLAIIIHKAPTALSLTAALLANSLSVVDCKKHLLYFSLATPVSSILSYGLHAFYSEGRNTWTGSALLFSGGTFLYVASVVQPISGQLSESPAGEISKTVRTMLLVGGMFFPVLVGGLVAHEHH